jgi:hypothetical protein
MRSGPTITWPGLAAAFSDALASAARVGDSEAGVDDSSKTVAPLMARRGGWQPSSAHKTFRQVGHYKSI